MRGGVGSVVWTQGLRRATRRLAQVSVLLLRMRGIPARGGTIHENHALFWNLNGVRVYSDFPLHPKLHFGSVGRRSKFPTSGAAGRLYRCKTGDVPGSK